MPSVIDYFRTNDFPKDNDWHWQEMVLLGEEMLGKQSPLNKISKFDAQLQQSISRVLAALMI